MQLSHLPWKLSRAPASDFTASISMRQFDDYRLIKCACDATRGIRSVNEIANTSARTLSLLHLRDGREAVTISDNKIILEAGDLVLWDSERPMSFNVPERLEKLTLMLPYSALTSVFPNAHDYVGQVITRQAGLSALLTNHLDTLYEEMWTMSNEDLTAAMKPTMDLLAAVLTMKSQLPQQSLRTLSLARVQKYIIQSLADPDLGPGSIAAGNGITVRYLHHLFEDVGMSVSCWIKQLRLERCRDDIRCSISTGRSITDIAFSWGFNDLSHFSRAFKNQFSLPPREYRRQAELEAKQLPFSSH
ncbi:MAG: helix-turn-helix domain-containing protein [Pseudomonadota bacterium]